MPSLIRWIRGSWTLISEQPNDGKSNLPTWLPPLPRPARKLLQHRMRPYLMVRHSQHAPDLRVLLIFPFPFIQTELVCFWILKLSLTVFPKSVTSSTRSTNLLHLCWCGMKDYAVLSGYLDYTRCKTNRRIRFHSLFTTLRLQFINICLKNLWSGHMGCL